MQRDARPDVRLNGRNRLKGRKAEDGASKRLWNGWQVRRKEGKEGAAVARIAPTLASLSICTMWNTRWVRSRIRMRSD